MPRATHPGGRVAGGWRFSRLAVRVAVWVAVSIGTATPPPSTHPRQVGGRLAALTPGGEVRRERSRQRSRPPAERPRPHGVNGGRHPATLPPLGLPDGPRPSPLGPRAPLPGTRPPPRRPRPPPRRTVYSGHHVPRRPGGQSPAPRAAHPPGGGGGAASRERAGGGVYGFPYTQNRGPLSKHTAHAYTQRRRHRRTAHLGRTKDSNGTTRPPADEPGKRAGYTAVTGTLA